MILCATAHQNIRKNKTQTLSFCTQHIFGTYNVVQPDFCYGVAARFLLWCRCPCQLRTLIMRSFYINIDVNVHNPVQCCAVQLLSLFLLSIMIVSIASCWLSIMLSKFMIIIMIMHLVSAIYGNIIRWGKIHSNSICKEHLH